jgi:hypothetical protein
LVKKEMEKEDSRVAVPNSPRAWGSRGGTVGVELRENEPVLVDIGEFNYSYRCKHCGHEWFEVRRKENVKSVPDNYPQEWRADK